MAFFSPEKLSSKRIEIDSTTQSSDSPEIQKRLARIEANYDQLENVLVDLETRIAADERLQAMDSVDVDFEAEFGVKPKRKWRSASSKKKSTRKRAKSPKRSSSADPRKPR
ncbi:MAG: hypothetical protein AAFN77_14455 [Planctomycetota bacterium]